MKPTFLTATSFALAVTTISVHAEEQQLQAQLACATVTLCQEMSAVIQAQIQELEQSDNPDFDLLDTLQNKLIALEGATQTHQEKTITSENKRQEQLREQTNQELAELNSQLSALRGILLDK